MFHAVDLEGLHAIDAAARDMFRDRGKQFVDRHKWPLAVDAAGFEMDEFDDPQTTFCVVEEDDRHLASLRLRPADAGSMVERYFPDLWQAVEPRLRGGVEVTRFCAAPELSADDRLMAVSDLLLGLCRHCQRTRQEKFFGVVFPSVARALKQSGWEGEVLGRAEDASGVLLLVEWTASELISWSIQEKREAREQIWEQRRAAVVEADVLIAA